MFILPSYTTMFILVPHFLLVMENAATMFQRIFHVDCIETITSPSKNLDFEREWVMFEDEAIMLKVG
jgi:hypothetical protein